MRPDPLEPDFAAGTAACGRRDFSDRRSGGDAPRRRRATAVGAVLCAGLAAGLAQDPPAESRGESAVEQDILPLLERYCLSCHGGKAKGGLRLDSREDALRGGDSGAAIVPGKSSESRLFRYVTGDNERGIIMPPRGQRLSATEVKLLRDWIDQGARWPAGGRDEPARPTRSDHWAFQPVVRPAVPLVRPSGWIRTPIDAFILARLEREGIAPSPEADGATLCRRLHLDVTGLPPTPDHLLVYLGDSDPDRYERLVDRLLASPRYGERWGRHWLDVARYADSEGYEFDLQRSVWKYRDWVIDALNRDLPFDQFTVEQIAGDLLPGATREQRVATGFHRQNMGTSQQESIRLQGVVDRVNATATVFLGLTLGCSQCHAHKFDPISQREYYEFFAFFNNSDDPVLEFATPGEVARRDAIREELAGARKELESYRQALSGRLADWEAGLTAKTRAELARQVREILEVPAARRSEAQKSSLIAAFEERDGGYTERQARIAELEAREPKFVTTLVVNERANRRDTHVFVRGDFENKGDQVSPGVPRVLPPLEAARGIHDRLDLARWLVSPEAPLTARVTVNRIWQRYFGLGIVETENDFGAQGKPPSHPELLDWLASEFVESGWSLKKLHRLILSSATYRQSSRARSDLREVDPRNRLLARASRLRLEAEIIRDQALGVSGLLCSALGGPCVFPYQAPGVMDGRADKSRWTLSAGESAYRRGIYIHFWRLTPHPFLRMFDAPDAVQSCTRRSRSNTPLQALALLNDPWFVECARALADRILREAPPSERLDRAFRLALARAPRAPELEILQRLLCRQLAAFTAAPERALAMVANDDAGGTAARQGDGALRAAWFSVARALLNADEFIMRE